jgi:SET domain-containing protein
MGKTMEKMIIGNTTQKGRGVFAQRPLLKGELLEIVPVIVIPEKERTFIDQTVLTNYYYEWGEYGIALGTGFALMYNHSYYPNAIYVKKIEQKVLEYFVWRNIEAGEEITINYNSGNPEDLTPLWFNTVK